MSETSDDQIVSALRNRALDYVKQHEGTLADLLLELRNSLREFSDIGMPDAYASRVISGLLTSDILALTSNRLVVMGNARDD
jgi:hypothetical protein